MPILSASWIPTFDACLATGDVDGAITCLDAMKTGHAGTAPQAVKDTAITRMREVYGSGSERTREIGLSLADSGNATAQEIGISLLPPFYDSAAAAIDERFLMSRR